MTHTANLEKLLDNPHETWWWLNDTTLVTTQNGSRVVLLGAHLQTRDPESGLLVPLKRSHRVARLLEAAPELLAEVLDLRAFRETAEETERALRTSSLELARFAAGEIAWADATLSGNDVETAEVIRHLRERVEELERAAAGVPSG